MQVWVRQKVEENDLSLFVELPQHLRAAVAWHWNKPVLDKVHIFKVCYTALLTVLDLASAVSCTWHEPQLRNPQNHGVLHSITDCALL